MLTSNKKPKISTPLIPPINAPIIKGTVMDATEKKNDSKPK